MTFDVEMSIAASARPSGSSITVSNSPTYSPRFSSGTKAPSSKSSKPTKIEASEESIDREFEFEVSSENFDELDVEMSVATSARPSGSSITVSNSPTYSPRFSSGAKTPSSKSSKPTKVEASPTKESSLAAYINSAKEQYQTKESLWAAYRNSAKEQHQDAISQHSIEMSSTSPKQSTWYLQF